MKFNHRRKDKWVKPDTELKNEWFVDQKKAKTERREKHQNKVKRLHQYSILREIDFEE
jgi:hypothetical protein